MEHQTYQHLCHELFRGRSLISANLQAGFVFEPAYREGRMWPIAQLWDGESSWPLDKLLVRPVKHENI